MGYHQMGSQALEQAAQEGSWATTPEGLKKTCGA